MAKPSRVTFTESAAKRIAAATLAVERGSRDMPGVKFRQVGDENEIRLGRVAATWEKDATAEVEELDQDGNPLDPAVTFEARNWFATITVGSGSARVACAFARGAWFVISAECSQ